MAYDEINLGKLNTGKTVRAIYTDPATNKVYNNTGASAGTTEVWDDASVADYAVTVTEKGTSGIFAAQTPALVPVAYSFYFYEAPGGTIDLTQLLGTGSSAAAAGGTDWSDTEKQQIRYRLGVDGTESTPAVNTDTNVDAGGGGSGTGTGDTPVDHNFGGIDALKVTYNGSGADNAQIIAYLLSEYAAGSYVSRGVTWTGPDGRWAAPLMLNMGQSYNLVVRIAGVTQPKVYQLDVP